MHRDPNSDQRPREDRPNVHQAGARKSGAEHRCSKRYLRSRQLGIPDQVRLGVGRYQGAVEVERVNGHVWLQVGAHRLRLLAERRPEALPWKALDVQIAVEASGAFETYAEARRHIDAGAAHVVLAAPAKDEDGEDTRTVLMGVNPQDVALSRVSSNASCTTNSAAPVIDVLREHIGVRKAILNTA